MNDNESRFHPNPGDNSDREHEDAKESLMLAGWKPVEGIIGSVSIEDLPTWVNALIDGEENEVITLARTKAFSMDGIQAWLCRIGRAEPSEEMVDVVAHFYYEDDEWHLEESPSLIDSRVDTQEE